MNSLHAVNDLKKSNIRESRITLWLFVITYTVLLVLLFRDVSLF
jgi:hypothetical protein